MIMIVRSAKAAGARSGANRSERSGSQIGSTVWTSEPSTTCVHRPPSWAHEGRCTGRLVVRRRLLTRLANAGMFRVARLLTLILHVDSDLPSRQAAVARARSAGPVWAIFVGPVAGRQAASLADGDSAAMTVSAETGIENMGKS